ncbi:VPA1262 family protein [Variovorax sp. OV700]|uniref:VPA1262 family protein n=1 Tax=Variovorax sp. OV700 TaxID=1882826 RepID=UPI00088484D9|nr:VPA1262 family protein [Variovorax sp. OV700]SDI18967.1 hypothetical protein SAMN05444748_10474 [Variovorax sp. OV700]
MNPSSFELIVSDPRLDRIVGDHDRHVAIQLWLLQLQADSFQETRLLYGRVLPFDYSNNSWNAPREDAFRQVTAGLKAQVLRLNLYCAASSVATFLRHLVGGSDLQTATAAADLNISSPLQKRVGDLLLSGPLAFRPVMHLPSRQYYRWATSRHSPVVGASADSAAIASESKLRSFAVGRRLNPELARLAVGALNADTGMEFHELDAWRLGDIELLVFPTLDDLGRPTFDIEGKPADLKLILHNSIDLAGDIRVRLTVLNDNCDLEVHERHIAGAHSTPLTIGFALQPAHLEIVDAYRLEIDAQDATGRWVPRLRWGTHLVREAGFSIHAVGANTRVKNDWLTVALRPVHEERVANVQQITRQSSVTSSTMGRRRFDAWVPLNRQVTSIMKSLVPPASDARFFLRYSEGDNTGRLELAEWLKKLLAEHRNAQVIWFDPFMEDIGIEFLNQYGANEGDYVVITCLPEPKLPGDFLDRKPSRIDNLLAACKSWSQKYGSVRLRVVALPFGEIHDRMITIQNGQGEPIIGFHLSNSIQAANKNHPLLVTSIPIDVLRPVVDYARSILGRLAASPQGGPSVLFDSEAHAPESKPRFTRDDVYAHARAGEVLGWWVNDKSFAGLSGRPLATALIAHGLADDRGLKGIVFEDMPASIWSQGLPLPEFNSAWDAISLVLASTSAPEGIREADSNPGSPLSLALRSYLDIARADAIDPPEPKGGLVNMTATLDASLIDLLDDQGDPQRMFPPDVTEVFWGDYYAIRTLWVLDPANLVRWIEEEADPTLPSTKRRQLSLRCAIRVITFETARGFSRVQLQALLTSGNDFLRWIGFHLFEEQLNTDPKELAEFGRIPNLTGALRIRLLVWLIERANPKDFLRGVLITELLELVSPKVTDEELGALISSVQSKDRRLHSSSPWFLDEIIAPLVESGRLPLEPLTRIWMDELKLLWSKSRDTERVRFRRATQGTFTDEVAVLATLSDSQTLKWVADALRNDLTASARVIQAPLAAHADWTETDNELDIAAWAGALVARILKNLTRPHQMETKFHELQSRADDLASRRAEQDKAGLVSQELNAYRNITA